MRWGFAALLLGAAALVAGSSFGLTVMGAAGVWALAMYLGRCRHPGPLGLLPPTHEADGTRVSAKWFCGTCGHSWPASFERDHVPVPKFTGYDQSKLPKAAQRAAELERKRQGLALRRAGLVFNRQPSRPDTKVPALRAVVPIERGRRNA